MANVINGNDILLLDLPSALTFDALRSFDGHFNACKRCCLEAVVGASSRTVAQSIVLYRTCTGQPAVWALSRLARPSVIWFFFFRGSLVTWWQAPGGF